MKGTLCVLRFNIICVNIQLSNLTLSIARVLMSSSCRVRGRGRGKGRVKVRVRLKFSGMVRF